MLELTLNAEMAVKLIKLKKQAQIELGDNFSIVSEDEVKRLLIATATFQHKHSKARAMARELIDAVEQLDIKERHTEFIAHCRGLEAKAAEQEALDNRRIYRGQVISDDEEQPHKESQCSSTRIYRGQKILEEAPAAASKTKTIYYRGQKILAE